MAEPRYRYSGRRSPTYNPARASMPVSIGYNPHYSGDLHTVQTARYDASVPRRTNDHKTPANPTATITTYNVTKDPPTAQRSSNTSRRRSSTVDSGAVKPIIVTTNHASRPHGSSSHASTTTRGTSPSRDPYRSSDETYYTQPASSMRGRSQHRYGHGYSQSATLSNDEFSRLRERVGDDRLRPPTHVATDFYRYSLPHAGYVAPTHDISTAVVDYDNEGYEYTKPSDLARYDLDHDRQLPHRNRRESIDRSYHRPTVNVVSNDIGRYDGRTRGPPPTSVGLDRYNRAAAAGIYDRPTVTMPALPPPVPAAPPVDPLRRIEAPRDPSPDRKVSRPRPVSMYQDAPARISHTDDLYRSHDDERLHRRRDRDDGYRDDDVTARGFGIRTNTLEQPQPDRPARSVDRRDYDDRRLRRDAAEREPRRRSDESIDYTRSHDSRKASDEPVTRADTSSRDSRDGSSQKNGIGSRTRDKVAAGLGAAAVAALGLAPKESAKEDDRKVSPRRREVDEEKDSRASERYRPRERDGDRKASPKDDQVTAEQRREPRKEQGDAVPSARDRELERERVRERAYERERERELRDLEKERERERSRREDGAKANGSAAVDARDSSPASEDSATASRRRRRPSGTFDPTDPKVLSDVKAELAAKEGQEKPKEKSASKERTSEDDATTTGSADERASTESREESRGREATPKEEKQVRVVSPPREKSEQKPIKGILKTPSAKFPEEENPIREGVAPHKDDKSKKGVPPGARWTKINRKLINPAALEIGKERFEVRDDFVIVLRVLSKEEIQAYANATAQIRAEKRREYEKQFGPNHGYEHDRDYSDDENRRTTRRHRRDQPQPQPQQQDDDPDYRRYRDRDDDRERHRRYRRGSDSDDDDAAATTKPARRAIEYDAAAATGPRHHRASHRDRDYDAVPVGAEDRR